MTPECDQVMSAIRRGEESLPRMRAATGIEYARLHIILHKLEFEWKSISRSESVDGFDRYRPSKTEKIANLPREVLSVPPQAARRTEASVFAEEAALIQRNAPFCVACRGMSIMSGRDRNGRQRWRCKPCGASFLGSGAMNDIKSEKRTQAVALFKQGKSLRTVAAEVGMATNTAQRIRDSLPSILCACGQDAKHQGWCEFRLRRSPARQVYLERLRGTVAHIDIHEEAEQKIREMVGRGRVAPSEVCCKCNEGAPLFEGDCVDCLTLDQQTRFSQTISTMDDALPKHVDLGPEEERAIERMRGSETVVLEEEEEKAIEAMREEPELCACGKQSGHRGRCRGLRQPSASQEIASGVKEMFSRESDQGPSQPKSALSVMLATFEEELTDVAEKRKQLSRRHAALEKAISGLRELIIING